MPRDVVKADDGLLMPRDPPTRIRSSSTYRYERRYSGEFRMRWEMNMVYRPLSLNLINTYPPPPSHTHHTPARGHAVMMVVRQHW